MVLMEYPFQLGLSLECRYVKLGASQEIKHHQIFPHPQHLDHMTPW